MKKTINIQLFLFLNFNLSLNAQTQTDELLKSIASELINYKDYQAHCTFTFEFIHGGTRTTEAKMITQKNAGDTLCGFHYYFNTAEKYRKLYGDFTMYFNRTVYKSYKGEITRTSFHEKMF